ncbi:MAG: tocopherol cyclase family protein [Oscillospiraceae bacterium]
MANISNIKKDFLMLKGPLATKGYDRWWHSFTAENAETGEQKPFFIEYFVCNPDLAQDEPVLGQWIPSQINNKLPSYLMVKAGWWGEDASQIHRFFSLKDVSMTFNFPFSITADDCFCSENEMRGSVYVSEKDASIHPEYMCDSGELVWNLKIEKRIAFNIDYGVGQLFQKFNAFDTFWHAEGMKTVYEGELYLNGTKYLVNPETCYGYADKNWGSDFTNPWIWISSNNLTSRMTGDKLPNSSFAIGGGNLTLFGISHEKNLFGSFWYEGKDYEFNFLKFWTSCQTQLVCKETEDEILWHIRQETRQAVMESKIRCYKKNMLLINYENPNGNKNHNRLWSGGNATGIVTLWKRKSGTLYLVDEIIAENVGCEYGEVNDQQD